MNPDLFRTAEQRTVLSVLDEALSEANSCGYCKRDDGNFCFYTLVKRLNPRDYKDLIDRGWRRSGTLCYKQHQKISCCPHYTIRMSANNFKHSRDHRQTLYKWNSFIWGEEYTKLRKIQFPLSREEKRRQKQEFDLLKTIHESEYSECMKKCPKDKNGNPVGPAHKFEVNIEPADFTEEKFELFKVYQKVVHNDEDKQPSSFRRFLCDSPVQAMEENGLKYGSYHQCYRLDGELIAIGVLDLLPNCVSSVYFLYKPDLQKHGMGKLAALREIALAIEEGYGYYYLGYYIHTCPKMRYKSEFPPAELLDPESNVYHMFDEWKPQLDKFDYVSLDKPERTCRPKEEPYVSIGAHTFRHIWETGMPGIVSLEDVKGCDVGKFMTVQVGEQKAPAMYLRNWDEEAYTDERSISRLFGQLVATMGWDVARRVIVKLG